MHLLFVFLSIGFVISHRLSPEENENRAAMCGKYTEAKIYKGRNATRAEAPWSVYLNFHEGNMLHVCTGTVVSPRHILTASHCYTKDLSTNGTRSFPTSVYKPQSCDINAHYTLDDAFTMERITVNLMDGEPVKQNVSSVTMVKGCETVTDAVAGMPMHLFASDFAIMTMKEDMEFGDRLQPACVAHNTDFETPGTMLEIFSYGLNPPANVHLDNLQDRSTGILRHEKIRVMDFSRYRHLPYQFIANSPDNSTTTCPGDSGGGCVAKVEGKATVVGVLQGGDCSDPITRGTVDEMYSSVGYFSDATCQITGICEIPATTTTTMKTSTELLIIEEEKGSMRQRPGERMEGDELVMDGSRRWNWIISTVMVILLIN